MRGRGAMAPRAARTRSAAVQQSRFRALPPTRTVAPIPRLGARLASPSSIRRPVGSPIRSASTAPLISRSVQRIRQQGFGVSPTFARALADLRRRDEWIDPGTFRVDFRRAPHYRLKAPGDVRVAMVRGRGVLYQWPWWMGVGPTLVDVAYPADLPPVEQIDPSYDPDDEPDPELEVQLPVVTNTAPIPKIRIGEIKGAASYRTGLRQLAGRKDQSANTALIVYDSNGRAHLQVFSPGPSGHQIVWDGTLGQPRKPPPFKPGTAPFGNWMERWIRRVLQLRTGQRFLQKHPNATGPDLQAVP
jgi:hypothetical protein